MRLSGVSCGHTGLRIGRKMQKSCEKIAWVQRTKSDRASSAERGGSTTWIRRWIRASGPRRRSKNYLRFTKFTATSGRIFLSTCRDAPITTLRIAFIPPLGAVSGGLTSLSARRTPPTNSERSSPLSSPPSSTSSTKTKAAKGLISLS